MTEPGTGIEHDIKFLPEMEHSKALKINVLTKMWSDALQGDGKEAMMEKIKTFNDEVDKLIEVGGTDPDLYAELKDKKQVIEKELFPTE